jgi:23S rRNA pseudouridine2605 synthase
MILDGRVTVNGRVLTNPDVRVHPEREAISVDGKVVARNQRLYIMMNKPDGYVTTRSDERGRRTVYDLLKDPDHWLFPVGRLDRDSRGLLLFTNDTRWAASMMDPESNIPKVYEVRLDRTLSEEDLDRMASGVVLDDGYRTRPANVKRMTQPAGHWIEIAITEGKNRQVRRMLKALGYETLELIRTRIGPVSIKELREGELRPLTPDEIRGLKVKTVR